MTLKVAGSTSNWGNPNPIEDAVYSHLLQKWSIVAPNAPVIADFNPDNIAWDGMGSFHLWVRKAVRRGNRTELEGTGFMQYAQNLHINIIQIKNQVGQIDYFLDMATAEIERILWEYSPYWISGITHFDNVEVVEIDEPDNEANAFRDTWHNLVAVDAFYMLQSDFAIDTAPYTPSKPAGGLTYLP